MLQPLFTQTHRQSFERHTRLILRLTFQMNLPLFMHRWDET